MTAPFPTCKFTQLELSYGVKREDDWSSCAYFYLDQPENGLPKLLPVHQRIEGYDAALSKVIILNSVGAATGVPPHGFVF